MNKIKVIKKNANREVKSSFKSNEENSPPKHKQRDAVKTIENWIVDWRKRTEIETRLAYAELTRLRLRNAFVM